MKRDKTKLERDNDLLRQLCAEMYQIMGQFLVGSEGDPLNLLPIMDKLSAAQDSLEGQPELLPWFLPKDFDKMLEEYHAKEDRSEYLDHPDNGI